jgi:hypothetical protein
MAHINPAAPPPIIRTSTIFILAGWKGWYAGLGLMSKKVLIVTGDGGDSYEALYAYHRFLEAAAFAHGDP